MFTLHWKSLPFCQPPFISRTLSPWQSLVHPLFPPFVSFFWFHTKWNMKSLSFFVWLISLSKMPFNYVKNRFNIKLYIYIYFWGGAFLCLFIEMKVKAKVTQSCLTLCELRDCSLPGSSVHGILQTKTLEWVAIPFSRGSSQPRDWTQFLCISDWFITVWATREAQVRYFMLNVLS